MATWIDFVREARKRHTVITIDLLGHGRSDSPDDVERYRIERTLADITCILRRLRVSQPSCLGYSMGGRIALLAAVTSPSACISLVLEGASPGLALKRERAARKRNDEALARLVTTDGIGAFSNYWERLALFNTQRMLSRIVQGRIRAQRLVNNPIGIANTLRAAGTGVQRPVYKLLPKLRIPVLCIVGEYDRKFMSIAKRMCSKLPNGRVSIVAGAGHAPHLEKPSEFNRLVLNFLDETR
jgi:2-succinyl-6-hydroxy-2,4-cyclohexadiene-1-carboxylate synthase